MDKPSKIVKANKILFITYNITDRGTFLRANGFARELVNRGWFVDIICTSDHNHFKINSFSRNDVQIIEMPDLYKGTMRSGWDFWAIKVRIFWCLNKKYDIVHAFENRPAVIFPALLLKIKGARLFSDWCDWLGAGGSVEKRSNFLIRTILRPFETFFETKFRKFSSGTSVINDILYFKAKKIGLSNIKIIPNGADTYRFCILDSLKIKQKLNLDTNIIYISHLGRIFLDDAILLIESFRLLKKKIENVKLLILGNCNIDFTKYINSPDDLIQTGFISDELLNEYMNATDIFWVILNNSNANNGRMPLKITDIMALGKPMVYTKIDGLRNIIKPTIGMSSYPVPEDIVEKTISLCIDVHKRKELGKIAFQLALKEYSWSTRTDQLCELYKGLS